MNPVIVKRTSGEKVDYAAIVTGNGSVFSWTADRRRAVTINPAVADKVIAYYASRPAGGRLTFEDVIPIGLTAI